MSTETTEGMASAYENRRRRFEHDERYALSSESPASWLALKRRLRARGSARVEGGRMTTSQRSRSF